MDSSNEIIDEWNDGNLGSLKSDAIQNSDFLFDESRSSCVVDAEGDAYDHSQTPKRICLPEASTKQRGTYVMGLGKYRFNQIKVPTSAEIEKIPELAGKTIEEIRLDVSLWQRLQKCRKSKSSNKSRTQKLEKLKAEKMGVEVELVKTKQILHAKFEAYKINAPTMQAGACEEAEPQHFSILPKERSIKSFVKGFYAGNMKPDDFPEFSFDRYDGNLLIGKLSETDARDYLLAFPVGSIRVFPNALNFYLCAQLKELGSRALVENNVLLANWGHSNNSADSGSHRWYAGRREFLQNLEAKNKVKLALTLQQQQASQCEVDVRNANLVVAHGD